MQLNKSIDAIIFPIFDNISNQEEREIVQIFLQRFRDIRFLCNETRVVSAIIKTADLTGNSMSFISKILVNNGLKTSRTCFSEDFLIHVDQSISRIYEDLKKFWVENGCKDHAVLNSYEVIPSYQTV